MKPGLTQNVNNPGSILIIAVVLVLWFSMAFIALHITSTAEAADPGQPIFQSKCSSCHTIGGGVLVGPDLKGLTTRRDREWAIKFMMAPDQLIAQGDATAVELTKQYPMQMPNVGISRADAEAVLAYIDSQSSAPATQSTSSAQQPSTSGDPAVGKQLFVGSTSLRNGGIACASCHTAAGVGSLGGGSLGPDLTAAYNKYGQAGLPSVLGNIAFPTMQPVYAAHTLTPEEQANLVAFLQQASTGSASSFSPALLVLVAGGGVCVVFGLVQLVWRGRLSGERRSLVKRTH